MVSVAPACAVTRSAALVVCAGLLAGCVARDAGVPPAPRRVEPATAATGVALDPAVTAVRVLVYRDGPLANLGHNHVITAPELTGEVVSAGGGEYRFALLVPVAGLVIDDPAARATEGPDFAAAVDDAARDGTRTNLLGPRLLDAARYPVIGLRGATLTAGDGQRAVQVAVTVRDVTREFRIPVVIQPGADGPRLQGELRVTHGDLGLTPFTVMGGMLRVRDEFGIRFSVGLTGAG